MSPRGAAVAEQIEDLVAEAGDVLLQLLWRREINTSPSALTSIVFFVAYIVF